MPRSLPSGFPGAEHPAAAGCSEERGDYRFTALVAEQIGWVVDIERHSFACPWTAADFDEIIRDRSAVSLAMLLGETVVGYAVGYVDGADFHLANLAIAASQRRRGRGRALLHEMLRTAREKGCRICSLEVRESNSSGIELYRRCGFRQVGVRMDFYRKPRENALVMCVGIENF
jgi:[ribosomal protein S18]-alanine N-acetyltransferase